MAVNFESHKAVVILNPGEHHFGFPHIYSAVAFIERQLPQDDKVLFSIAESIDDGVEINGTTYQIMDISSYADVYGAGDDDEDEEDDE